MKELRVIRKLAVLTVKGKKNIGAEEFNTGVNTLGKFIWLR
jgi:hypothetical protein